jgi:dTDP-4-amino-4,6-dideoxygalactose transaminase
MEELQSIAQRWNVPIIEDAAQAIGATYKGRNIGEISEFTAFSFQAVKLLTTIDGGMLTVYDPARAERAKRLRWFGIDRKAKFENRWNNDIFEVGYKYQMTDVAAALGIGALNELADTLKHHRNLFERYKNRLARIPGITFVDEAADRKSACWLATIFADRRADLKRKLAEYNIEADPAHYRCDKHTIFGGRVKNCPKMDSVEDKYLLLPMHYHLALEDIDRVCDVISAGW